MSCKQLRQTRTLRSVRVCPSIRARTDRARTDRARTDLRPGGRGQARTAARTHTCVPTTDADTGPQFIPIRICTRASGSGPSSSTATSPAAAMAASAKRASRAAWSSSCRRRRRIDTIVAGRRQGPQIFGRFERRNPTVLFQRKSRQSLGVKETISETPGN